MSPISQKVSEIEKHDLRILSKEDKKQFRSMFWEVMQYLTEIPEYRDMPSTNQWLARVLQYNVPHGTLKRGLTTVLAYQYMAMANELTEENIKLSHVLGWCVEIMHGRCNVADDVMDDVKTRRGKPSWHIVDNLGPTAINDALLLESSVYILIQLYFEDHECYVDLIDVIHDVIHKKAYGRSLEIRLIFERKFESYTMENYKAITKYNSSYFTFYLPTMLAMIWAGINNSDFLEQVKALTLEIGHLFQVQNDYLNCFGDEKVTPNKGGTDIQDCKCTWLFVTAMENCTPEQKEYLIENYGQDDQDKVERIKRLYVDLCIPKMYKMYERDSYNSICNRIQSLPEKLPKPFFIEMVNSTYFQRDG